MEQTDVDARTGTSIGEWLFRVLLVAAAGFMVYTWFTPWWSADFAVIPGDHDMVMRPWGIEVAAQVSANADEDLWSMPWFFEPFMWSYLGVCMLALAVSIFVRRQIPLGRFKLQLATLLILIVGLSYLAAVGLAWGIGELRADAADSNFIGKSTIRHAMTGNKVKMVSDLRDGYWLALSAGPVLIVLSLVRGLFIRKPKA